ncbi:MAG TPA: methylaspartate mutase subunit E [Halanaerobiales bacterium]|nr:methylaspartate mutase subunit E [Halanaerobiales bacterium]
MNLRNEKIEIDKFFNLRDDILSKWNTGNKVDLDEVLDYYSNYPEEKFVINKMLKAKREAKTLIQPRAGIAIPDKFIELLNFLEKEGKADILPVTIDSYTRQNKYKEAQKGLKESKELGRSMLDGFPAVNHGINICRKIVDEINAPAQIRHGTPDARLLAEITLAGGFTDFEGGGISYNLPYAKKVSLEKTIKYWQYVDRLVGFYEENGVNINREHFGPLTGTLVPPAISHSVSIIEALLAAEQGVKYISLGYGQNGNLRQDVAAIHSLQELGDEYLKKYEHEDVEITTVFHQWLGGFPQEEAKAYGIIGLGATTAALSNVTKVLVKTPQEALKSPDKEANVAGLVNTKQIIKMLEDQSFDKSAEYELEKEMIKKEVREIIDKVLKLGDGDLAQGAVKAFESGVLDIPFSPSKYNSGKMLPARDINGAVRYLNFGKLPFSQEIKQFHRGKIEERAIKEEKDAGFQMAIDDIYAIGKGLLKG